MSSGYECGRSISKDLYARLPQKSKKGKMLWDDAPDERKQEGEERGGTVHMSKPFHCWISNLVSGSQRWWRRRFIICIIQSWAPSILIEK